MQEKVEKIIEKIRPHIQTHGGDVALLEISDGVVKLKVSGACVGCPMRDKTFNGILGGMIQEEIPEIKEIVIEN
ncbi:MAG: NifU family protein [Parcubacteria group bacterium]|mgnify:CR=1 FL=1|jgi:Fe-S cluster biogenesis protein NfuA|nr:NifU family protein [Parcubacteria group bacterium]